MPHRATYLFPRQFPDSLEAPSTNSSAVIYSNGDAKHDRNQLLTFLQRRSSPEQGFVQLLEHEKAAVRDKRVAAAETDCRILDPSLPNSIGDDFRYCNDLIATGDDTKVKISGSLSSVENGVESSTHKFKKRLLHDTTVYHDWIVRTRRNSSIFSDHENEFERSRPRGQPEVTACERDASFIVPVTNFLDIGNSLVIPGSSSNSATVCWRGREEDGQGEVNAKSYDISVEKETLFPQSQEGEWSVTGDEQKGGFQASLTRPSSGTAVWGCSEDDDQVDSCGVPSIRKQERERHTDDDTREDDGAGMDIKQGPTHWTMESYLRLLGLTKRLRYQGNTDFGDLCLHTGGRTTNSDTASHRLWLSGCLSYSDKIVDGFYNILGMNPYLWMMAIGGEEEGMTMPPLGSLKEIEDAASSIEVVLFDNGSDTILKELEEKVLEFKSVVQDRLVMTEKLGKLVAFCMGGSFSVEQGDLYKRWKVESRRLRGSCKSIVLPIGSLRVGLCRHRAILFKKLADCVGLPCRIARGCEYCSAQYCSSCFVKIEDEPFVREVVVDLVGKPGFVYGVDSLINATSSLPSPVQISHLKDHTGFDMSVSSGLLADWTTVENKHHYQIRHPLMSLEPSLGMDLLQIPWNELRIKEFLGSGSFGLVHRADWHGSDVAVKILNIESFQDGQLADFLREVSIMKRVRHPNLVLFMGAVISPQHLAIVSEYMHRGSLFRLIHSPAAGEKLDQRKRLRMALDVAKGINYLHCLDPPIVHWDIKSPNLLVDKNWTVKVCDFGLSRYKATSFPPSKSVAGTPEWMAPEFLRGEPSNEKSDVYGFGVILWELVTMQQPWLGLCSSQVVGAVAFQKRRPAIPQNVSPALAALIESCWADDPLMRPSFGTIVDSLKKLLKSPIQQLHNEDH